MKLGLSFKNQGTHKWKKGLFFLSEAPIIKSLFCFVFYTGCFLILAKDCFNSFGKIEQEILNTLYNAILPLNKIFLLTRHFILGDLRVEWTRVGIVDLYMHRILEAWQSTQAGNQSGSSRNCWKIDFWSQPYFLRKTVEMPGLSLQV